MRAIDPTIDKEKRADELFIDYATTNASDTTQGSIVTEHVDVGSNESKVLETLSKEGSSYTFRGLMRKLRMHQEVLSRSLHRLNKLGLIEKSKLGYKLSRKGRFLTKHNYDVQTEIPYKPLLQIDIPTNVNISMMVLSLVGRWFKNLRWLGMVGGGLGHMFQWTSQEGSFQVNLRIVGYHMIIETDAKSDEDKMDAMICAHRIFEHVSKLFVGHGGIAFQYVLSKHKPTNHA